MKSALILVGGRASRVDGFPKHQFMYGNKTFLERQVKELISCSDELMIVCRNERQIEEIPRFNTVQYIHDMKEGLGPAGGIHSGACQSKSDYIFVTACDMPFLSCKVINFLYQAAIGYDAAVPVWEDGKYEPLCAVYRCDAVRSFFERRNETRLSFLIQELNTKFIPVREIRAIDPETDVFCNINDFEGLSKIKN